MNSKLVMLKLHIEIFQEELILNRFPPGRSKNMKTRICNKPVLIWPVVQIEAYILSPRKHLIYYVKALKLTVQ